MHGLRGRPPTRVEEERLLGFTGIENLGHITVIGGEEGRGEGEGRERGVGKEGEEREEGRRRRGKGRRRRK